jgi:hypothetical protein
MWFEPSADSLFMFQPGTQILSAQATKRNLPPGSGSFAGYYFDNPATLFYIYGIRVPFCSYSKKGDFQF